MNSTTRSTVRDWLEQYIPIHRNAESSSGDDTELSEDSVVRWHFVVLLFVVRTTLISFCIWIQDFLQNFIPGDESRVSDFLAQLDEGKAKGKESAHVFYVLLYVYVRV